MIRNERLLFLLFIVCLLGFTGCKQSTLPPAVVKENSCVNCHTDEAKLLADLQANPLPKKEKAQSEGEG